MAVLDLEIEASKELFRQIDFFMKTTSPIIEPGGRPEPEQQSRDSLNELFRQIDFFMKITSPIIEPGGRPEPEQQSRDSLNDFIGLFRQMNTLLEKTERNINPENRLEFEQRFRDFLFDFVDKVANAAVLVVSHEELTEVKDEGRSLRHEVMLVGQRARVLHPRSEDELMAALWWLAEQGEEEDLELVRQVRANSPYSSGAVRANLDVTEERLRNRLARRRTGRAHGPVEEAALARGGRASVVTNPVGADPRERTKQEYRALLKHSLTEAEAASRLNMDAEAIRQRLTEKKLYGIKDASGWRLPTFQFERDHLVPGIEIVIPRLAADLHPLGVATWFTTPTSDLILHEKSVSPRDWLLAGGSPEVVAEIAAAL